MGLRSRLAHLATTAEAPVFAVIGGGYRSEMHSLRLAEGIRIVATPRHASVLLIAGALNAAAEESVRHVHDQMAGPRTTVAWGHAEPTVVPVAVNVAGGVADISAVIRRQFHEVVTGAIHPEPPLLPDFDPV